MRAQHEILEYFVKAWDIKGQCFRIGAHTFRIEVEDIYFQIDLSQRGSHITFLGMRRGNESVKGLHS